MQKINEILPKSPYALPEAALPVNNLIEQPTRDEFYTNYPFFKYWNQDKNANLSSHAGINIYIHIPYCIQICDYCFYMKELVRSKDQVNEYVDYLCREMKMVSETHNLKSRKVNSIYIGGGTPSVLTQDQFSRLMEGIQRHHDVDKPEFTFEAEPGTFSKKKLDWYKSSGVNRISMGVQSFDDYVIALSSRKHTVQQAIHSVEMVHEAGGFQVNIDLLSGLAGETMGTWEKSLETALDQKIDLLTIYKMKTYSNTAFFKKGVHRNEISLPSAEQEIEFFKTALAYLKAEGYSRWSTFAFTKTNHQHKYAENTWRGEDLIAYGVSSFGKLNNTSYQNLNNTQLYYDKLEANQIPVFRSYEMTYKDRIVKELLLCSVRLTSYSRREFERKFGFDYVQLIPDTISELHAKGYISSTKDEFVLTEHGILYGDFVGKVIASAVKQVIGPDHIGFTY